MKRWSRHASQMQVRAQYHMWQTLSVPCQETPTWLPASPSRAPLWRTAFSRTLLKQCLGTNSPSTGAPGDPQTRRKAQAHKFWIQVKRSEHTPTFLSPWPLRLRRACWSYLSSVKSKQHQVGQGRTQNSQAYGTDGASAMFSLSRRLAWPQPSTNPQPRMWYRHRESSEPSRASSQERRTEAQRERETFPRSSSPSLLFLHFLPPQPAAIPQWRRRQ